MAAYLPGYFNQQFFYNGAVASGQVLYVVETGTSTPKTVYTDQAGTIPYTQPIMLDADGMPEDGPFWILSGECEIRHYTAPTPGGALVRAFADVAGVVDAASLGDLASTSAPGEGAGMVGFGKDEAYANYTVGGKLLEIVSVQDYGADPSFAASVNRAAIQDAIDEVSTAGGGIVRLPYMYPVDASLTNKAGVLIQGFGRHTGITATGDFKVFQQNTGLGAVENLGWQNFRIVGPASGGYDAAKEGHHGINLFESELVHIKDMWFENLWGDGVYVRTNRVKIENVHCSDTYRQGVAVTDGDHISIKNVRGEGEMITLVDIEPNPGDQINHLHLDDIEHIDATIPALKIYHSVAVYDVVNHVTMSNITSTTLGITAVTDLTASNLLIGSSDGAVSLDLFACKDVVMSGVNIGGTGFVINEKLKASSCFGVTINGVNIEGGANIDVDLLGNENVTVNGMNLKNVGNIGVRLRNSTDTEFNSPYVEGATTHAFLLAPTTVNSKTFIRGIATKNCSTGVRMEGDCGDVYIDGDLSGCTTPYSMGGTFRGYVSKGSIIGVGRKLIDSATPTAGTYLVGDEVEYPAPVAAGFRGQVCTVSGTQGTLNAGATTGGITIGTPTLNLSVATGLAVGDFVSVAGAITKARVLTIVGTTVTLDANASATVAGAAVAFVNATFKTWGAISA